jgi:hypothetical protein
MGCYITQIVKPVSKWLGAAMVFLLVNTETGLAENGTGIGLGFRAMQKIWQGISEPTRYVPCRLATRSVIKTKQICVYRGANSTFLAIYNDAGGYCSPEIQCRYNPDKSQSAAGLVAAFKKAEAKHNKD